MHPHSGHFLVWEGLTAIAAGNHHIAGITSSKKVVTAGDDGTIDYYGKPEYEDITKWSNIIKISAGAGLTIAQDDNSVETIPNED